MTSVRGADSAFLPQPHGAPFPISIPIPPSTLICAADIRRGLPACSMPPCRPLIEDITCDALIVGGGITGALMAEQLTRQGLDVVIVDRELPGRGSTVASTSMLLWEIDRSLQELTHLYGYERAARAYRASYDAVHGLKALVRTLNLRCDMRAKDSTLSCRRRECQRADRGARASRARRPARHTPRSQDPPVRIRHCPGGCHRLAGLGRFRSVATGTGAAECRDGARRAIIRGGDGRVRLRRPRRRRSIDGRPHRRGPPRRAGHRLCDARYRAHNGTETLFELGDRDEAAAGQTLARRRADLGRQQGLSLRPNHRIRPHHHRRRRQRRDHRSRCTRCPDPCQGTVR